MTGMPMKRRFIYPLLVARVIDGDTIVADIDLGFDAWRRVRIRLADIDAPEMHGPTAIRGEAARQMLIRLIAKHRLGVVTGRAKLMVRTKLDGRGKQATSFRRYVGYLEGVDESGRAVDLNERMVEAGHALAMK